MIDISIEETKVKVLVDKIESLLKQHNPDIVVRNKKTTKKGDIIIFFHEVKKGFIFNSYNEIIRLKIILLKGNKQFEEKNTRDVFVSLDKKVHTIAMELEQFIKNNYVIRQYHF